MLNSKIEMIKTIRKFFEIGLIEAKNVVEAFMNCFDYNPNVDYFEHTEKDKLMLYFILFCKLTVEGKIEENNDGYYYVVVRKTVSTFDQIKTILQTGNKHVIKKYEKDSFVFSWVKIESFAILDLHELVMIGDAF